MYTLDQIKELAPSVFTTDKAPHLTGTLGWTITDGGPA